MQPSVETRAGRIRGERRAGVDVFRGIPFAAPPVASLRWRAPEPEKPWAGLRDATRAGPVAPQSAGFVARLLGSHEEAWDEDCLSLSVWTPARDNARRPVMVWIHGGGFTVGAGSWAVYDGAGLARRGDVVVVAINYRLGALGFLATPDRGDGPAANFGLLDQLAALRWVREHATEFGGDPERVTLFGGSAGAMSIASLSTAPAAQGLFARAILQSGAARNVHRPEAAERVATHFARELGAAPGDVDALRRHAASDVLAAQGRTSQALRPAMDALPFQPCVDDTLLPRLPREVFRKGEAARIPIIIGTNLEEWKFYGLGDPKAGQLDEVGLLRRCERILPGAHPAGGSRAERTIEAMREARRARGESISPRELWFAIETARWFREPAEELASHHTGRVWSFLFAWRTSALGGAAGACHSLEVPFVFGLDSDLGGVVAGDDSEAALLSQRMQDAWLAFARDADPRTEPLSSWRPYTTESRATQLLGGGDAVVGAFRERERLHWERLGT
jgi:para-nitrobenzyl esterase